MVRQEHNRPSAIPARASPAGPETPRGWCNTPWATSRPDRGMAPWVPTPIHPMSTELFKGVPHYITQAKQAVTF